MAPDETPDVLKQGVSKVDSQCSKFTRDPAVSLQFSQRGIFTIFKTFYPSPPPPSMGRQCTLVIWEEHVVKL